MLLITITSPTLDDIYFFFLLYDSTPHMVDLLSAYHSLLFFSSYFPPTLNFLQRAVFRSRDE